MHVKAAVKSEKEIVNILKEAKGEVSFSDLRQQLRTKGLDDDLVIKTAIWLLITERVIELTPLRKLVFHRINKSKESVG